MQLSIKQKGNEMSTGYEQQIAMMEGMINHLSDEYFEARPQLDSTNNRRIFESGANRMYELIANKNEQANDN